MPGSIAEWRTYGRLWVFLRPYSTKLILVLFVSLFSTGLGLAQPYLSKLLIDQALMLHDMRALIRIAGLLFAVTVVGYVLNILASYRYVQVSAAMLFDMRVALFRHLQTLSPRFYARFRMGDLLSRLNTDVGEVQRVSADTVLSVLSNVLFFIGCVGMMIWLNWKLFLVGVILAPGAVASFAYYQRKLTALTKKLRERGADLGSFFVDTILGMRVIVAMGAADHEARRFRECNDAYVESMLKVQVASFMTGALPGTILTAATSAVFLYGGWLIFQAQMTIGTLVAFMAYHMRLLSPIQTLMGMTAGLASARVSLGRIFELFDTPPEVKESEAPRPLPGVRGSIRIENVSLTYDRAPVLRDVSIEIPAGSVCAILGPTGAGKSTLADLIVRYLDPDEGRIVLCGHDIREFALADLRREIVLVDQSPYLFNATLGENIAFALSGCSRADVEAAASAAGLDELLARLPEGFETKTGERGLALSAGERQRVALARAILRRPRVLILDEPTSALDPRTEQQVALGLRAALPEATLIVITHRLALAEIADAVFTIENGRAASTHA